MWLGLKTHDTQTLYVVDARLGSRGATIFRNMSAQFCEGRSWRILAVKRSSKIAPAASAVRGIATIRGRVICGKVTLRAEEVKNSNKPLWRKAFLRVS